MFFFPEPLLERDCWESSLFTKYGGRFLCAVCRMCVVLTPCAVCAVNAA